MTKFVRNWNNLTEPTQFGLIMIFVAICFLLSGAIFSVWILYPIGWLLELPGLVYVAKGLGLLGRKREN